MKNDAQRAWAHGAETSGCDCTGCLSEQKMAAGGLRRALEESEQTQRIGEVLVASAGRDAEPEFVHAMIGYAEQMSTQAGLGPHLRGGWRLAAATLRTLRPAPTGYSAGLAELNKRFIRHSDEL